MQGTLFIFITILLGALADASLNEAKFVRFVSLTNPPLHTDRSFAFGCMSKCGRSVKCAATNVLVKSRTCSYLTQSDVDNLADFDELLYKKTYPEPPTCKNGGYWADDTETYCICSESFTGTYCERYWEDCSEGFSLDVKKSGVYTVQPKFSPVPFQTYCDQRWGGRTYIQRQEKGINFYRSWKEYRDGFGNPNGDHWLGLQKIKELCDSNPCRLLIHFEYESQPTWAQCFYHNFTLTNETDGYRLLFSHMSVSGNSKNQLDDGLTEIKGAKFSTFDRDNDDNPNESCAKIHYSGWWFKNCAPSNLNGRLNPIPEDTTGMPEVIFWPGDTRGASVAYISLRLYH